MSEATTKVRKAKRRPASDVKIVRLKLIRIEFLSAVRMGLLIQLGLAVATLVGFLFLWFVLNSTGLFKSLSDLISSVIGTSPGDSLPLGPVMSFAGAISIFNIVTGTLLSGVIALVYNAIAKMSGGLAIGFTNN